VRRSGLYAYQQGHATVAMAVAAVPWLARVQAIATHTCHRYGSRRRAKPLQAAGYAVGRDTARQLDVAPPETVWVGDIPSGWPAEGGEYLAGLWDWYARTVVGWAMPSQSDAPWVPAALRRALGRRQPAAGLLPQTERGRQ